MNNLVDRNINALDSLRAFAALSVCAFHFVCTTIGFISNESILSFFSIGKYGVQVFFVISGFIIPWSMYQAGFVFKNFFIFLSKRLIRLEPPYLISIFLAILFFYLREFFFDTINVHNVISIKQVFLHLGYLIPFFDNFKWLNQVYWTLAIEFQYYFFMALVFVPLLNLNFAFRIALYLMILATSYFSSSAFLPYWLPIFLLGIISFLYLTQKIKKIEFFISLILLVVFCVFKYGPILVLCSLIPVFVLLFFSNYKVYGLDFLGKFSYSIYLIHSLVGASFINIVSHHVTSPFAKFCTILGGLFLTILSAYFTYYFIEKPSKKLSSKIKYEKK